MYFPRAHYPVFCLFQSLSALFLATMAMPSKSLLRIVSTKKVFSKKKIELLKIYPPAAENATVLDQER